MPSQQVYYYYPGTYLKGECGAGVHSVELSEHSVDHEVNGLVLLSLF